MIFVFNFKVILLLHLKIKLFTLKKIKLRKIKIRSGVQMKISDLLIKDRISLDVKSTTKVDIIKELARLHEKQVS